MKTRLFLILILIVIQSCGLLATIDAPKKNDFFEGRFDSDLFFSLNSNYISFDSCLNNKRFHIWQTDSFKIKNHFVFEGEISEDSLLKIFKSHSFQSSIGKFHNRNIGYMYNFNKDTIKCELLTRITIGSYNFNCFEIFDLDSISFKCKYTKSRPYKFSNTNWTFCSNSKHILVFKKF